MSDDLFARPSAGAPRYVSKLRRDGKQRVVNGAQVRAEGFSKLGWRDSPFRVTQTGPVWQFVRCLCGLNVVLLRLRRPDWEVFGLWRPHGQIFGLRRPGGQILRIGRADEIVTKGIEVSHVFSFLSPDLDLASPLAQWPAT